MSLGGTMLTAAADQARNLGNSGSRSLGKQVEQDALATSSVASVGERERENLGTTGVFGSGPRKKTTSEWNETAKENELQAKRSFSTPTRFINGNPESPDRGIRIDHPSPMA